MNIKLVLILCISLSVIGCSMNPNTEVKEAAPDTATPEVLKANRYKWQLSDSRSYYEVDMIRHLYEEAVEKDSALNTLNTWLVQMQRMKGDSLAAYTKYAFTNNTYWSEANKYIGQIHDSILREATREIFVLLGSKYQESVAAYEASLIGIGEKAIILEDQVLILKLAVTAPMIAKYQKNELPDIEALKSLIEEYDQLIEETKKHGKIQ